MNTDLTGGGRGGGVNFETQQSEYCIGVAGKVVNEDMFEYTALLLQ